MISVVIPVSEQSRPLKKCLLHLKAQQNADYEVILIDDASTDNSLQVAKAVLTNWPDSTIIEHNRRLGLWPTRKEGIRMAKGRTLLFLDPREWLEPGALKRLSDTLDSFDVDMVQMKRQRYLHNVPLKLTDHPEAEYWKAYTDDEYRNLTRFIGNGSCITPFCGDKLYKTELLREASNIEFHGEWGEVQVMNINYLRLARSLVLTDFAGINADWVHNFYTFKFSRLEDYKKMHTLKRCLCSDKDAVDNELHTLMRQHISQLLGELAWTPDAVMHFMGNELLNSVWQQVGIETDIQKLIAQEQSKLRRTRLRSLLKRLVR